MNKLADVLEALVYTLVPMLCVVVIVLGGLLVAYH